MPAAIKNFIMETGSDFTRLVRWKDLNGNLVAVSSYIYTLRLISNWSDSTEIAEYNSDDVSPVITNLGDETGIVRVSIPSAVVDAYSFSSCFYTLTAKDIYDQRSRLLEGRIIRRQGA